MTLENFIVEAKSACYVGEGAGAASSRLGSHDLVFQKNGFSYRDSYFGGTDFLGQEVVWEGDVPVWAMNYYGAILRADLIDAQKAGDTIKAALSELYKSGRFLGGHIFRGEFGDYTDQSEGGFEQFTGCEWIDVEGARAYELHYHGGLIIA